jgi:hypothetical protein
VKTYNPCTPRCFKYTIFHRNYNFGNIFTKQSFSPPIDLEHDRILAAYRQAGALNADPRNRGLLVRDYLVGDLTGSASGGITSTSATLGAVLLKDRECSQFIYSLMLLAAAAISTLLNISPITTLSRLAVGDHYTSGWEVVMLAGILSGFICFYRK